MQFIRNVRLTSVLSKHSISNGGLPLPADPFIRTLATHRQGSRYRIPKKKINNSPPLVDSSRSSRTETLAKAAKKSVKERPTVEEDTVPGLEEETEKILPSISPQSNEKKNQKCPGCGIKLQTTDRNQLGFHIPQEKRAESIFKTPNYAKYFTKEVDDLASQFKKQQRNTIKLQLYQDQLRRRKEKEKAKEGQTSEEGSADVAEPKLEDEFGQIDEETIEKVALDPDLQQRLDEAMGKIEANLPPTTQFVTEQDLIMQEKRQRQSRAGELCQRCFMLKHQGKVAPVTVSFQEFRQKLSGLATRKVIIFKVVDIFDFDGSFVREFRDVIGDNPVYLIVNKVDLLPEKVSMLRVENWIRRECRNRKLEIEGLFFVSSLKQTGINTLIYKFLDNKEALFRQDVFVVGTSNAGKSTFVNTLINKYNVGDQLKPTTTSPIPGTTLNIIRVPLPSGAILYDTPGVYNPEQMVNMVEPAELSLVLPRKRILPIVLSAIAGQTLFIGGMARIDVLEGPRFYFTIFRSSDVVMHMTKTEKAENLYEKYVGGVLKPPLPADQRSKPFPNLVSKEIVVVGESGVSAAADIVISGLGWVSVTGVGTFKFKVFAPEGVAVNLRTEPLLPYETPSKDRRDVVVSRLWNQQIRRA
eukprot:TRINITY_DN7059_c0_g1_i1.p1 TRINITY_DN7059_c0_g1~~TRINITY_DN7059_c0_g1_i1.p1  ORF type:complete len:640 (-),score=123.01 TRINITY_DN7059_c0_g1_i1:11-1930(-)